MPIKSLPLDAGEVVLALTNTQNTNLYRLGRICELGSRTRGPVILLTARLKMSTANSLQRPSGLFFLTWVNKQALDCYKSHEIQKAELQTDTTGVYTLNSG